MLFININILRTLTEPDVEPAQAPMNIKINNKNIENSFQMLKSTELNPVVVRIETT